jgi:hypothetical protein
MIALGISTGMAILALIGLLVGLVAALLVVALFNRIVAPAVEIDGYASDILAGGVGIAKNLDGVDELARTRDLATSVPPLAVAYLEMVKRRLQ